MLAPWNKSYGQPRQHIKIQRHYFVNKGPSSQSYGLSSSHVWMWELDHKEGWASKNWCIWTVVLEKTLESPLDCKENPPVNPQGNQFWIFIGRTDAENEAPIFGHLIWRADSLEKTLMLGKIEGTRRGQQRMKWLDGITNLMDMSLRQTPGVGDGQGNLACCSPWGCKESDTTEWLNWTNLYILNKSPLLNKIVLNYYWSSAVLLLFHLYKWYL